MASDLTKQDLIDALRGLATKEDLLRFATKQDLLAIREEMATSFSSVREEMETSFSSVREEMEKNHGEVLQIINTLSSSTDAGFAHMHEVMATKEYVDKRITQSEHAIKDFVDRRASKIEDELSAPLRAVDEKDTALITHLGNKKVIAKPDVAAIVALSPFAAR